MDVKSFLDRTNLSKADLLRKIGKDPKSSLIAAYENGTSNPSFDVALKLLKVGMTPRELFGEEIDEMLRSYYQKENSLQLPHGFDNAEFKGSIPLAKKCDKAKEEDRPMTKNEILAMLKDLKDKGQI